MEVNSRYIPGDTQDVKQDANLAIPQQRQTFPKNETINGKKVSLLFVLFESSEKIQTSICQQQVSDFISQQCWMKNQNRENTPMNQKS
jgi:hypothetical protein